MIWYYVVYDVVWGMVWHGMAWYAMIWYYVVYDVVWGMVWHGTAWYAMIWYYVVYDVVWYGMLRHDMARSISRLSESPTLPPKKRASGGTESQKMHR